MTEFVKQDAIDKPGKWVIALIDSPNEIIDIDRIDSEFAYCKEARYVLFRGRAGAIYLGPLDAEPEKVEYVTLKLEVEKRLCDSLVPSGRYGQFRSVLLIALGLYKSLYSEGVSFDEDVWYIDTDSHEGPEIRRVDLEAVELDPNAIQVSEVQS